MGIRTRTSLRAEAEARQSTASTDPQSVSKTEAVEDDGFVQEVQYVFDPSVSLTMKNTLRRLREFILLPLIHWNYMDGSVLVIRPMSSLHSGYKVKSILGLDNAVGAQGNVVFAKLVGPPLQQCYMGM